MGTESIDSILTNNSSIGMRGIRVKSSFIFNCFAEVVRYSGGRMMKCTRETIYQWFSAPIIIFTLLNELNFIFPRSIYFEIKNTAKKTQIG